MMAELEPKIAHHNLGDWTALIFKPIQGRERTKKGKEKFSWQWREGEGTIMPFGA